MLFKDSKGREFNLKLSVSTVDRVAEATKPPDGKKGLDLLGVRRGAAADYETIMGDESILMLVVWYIIKPQAEKLNITAEDFRDSIDGDALERMTNAFVDAIADFSPTHRREVIRVGWKKANHSMEQASQGTAAAIDKADLATVKNEAERMMTEKIKETLDKLTAKPCGSSSTNLPE